MTSKALYLPRYRRRGWHRRIYMQELCLLPMGQRCRWECSVRVRSEKTQACFFPAIEE